MSAMIQILAKRYQGLRAAAHGADIVLLCNGQGLETCMRYAEQAWKVLKNMQGVTRHNFNDDDPLEPAWQLRIEPEHCRKAVEMLATTHTISLCEYTGGALTSKEVAPRMTSIAVISTVKKAAGEDLF